jgi:hypothetical protein
LPFTTPTTTPTMPIQKQETSFSSPQANSIMKSVAEQKMSMSELNDSTARMGLTDDIKMNVGGVSIPILQGSWQKKSVERMMRVGSSLLLRTTT